MISFDSFVTFLVTILLASSVSASPKRSVAQYDSDHKVFKACTHELPPHSMKQSDGQPGGLATEVLMAVSKNLGWKLEIEYFPWMRARYNAEEGKCDLIYTILKKSEYEKFAIFPEQGLTDRYNVLITRKKSHLHYTGDLEAFMKSHSIGTYRDKVVSPLFEKLKSEPWARIEYTSQSENNLLKLLGGRIDAAVENRATAVYELRQMGRLNEVDILSPPLLKTPAYIAFSKKGKALPYIKDFDRELVKFKETPEFLDLVDKFEN